MKFKTYRKTGIKYGKLVKVFWSSSEELTFPILTSSVCSKVEASCSQVGAMALQWPHQGAKNFMKWEPGSRTQNQSHKKKRCHAFKGFALQINK